MMTTYKVIQSIVLSTNTTTVTFSSIPQTYTHLILLCYARSNLSNDTYQYLRLNMNGQTGISNALYGFSGYGSGSVSAMRVTSTQHGGYLGPANAGTSTASTFSNNTIFIPNYSVSSRTKISYAFGASENNATAAAVQTIFNRHDTTNAITSLSLQVNWGDTTAPTNSLVTNSVFTLYGISNT